MHDAVAPTQTKGSWRVAYWSPMRAFWVSSGAPIIGCRHGVVIDCT